MKKINHSIVVLTAISLLIASYGCKKDYQNPNAAPEESVFTSARGLTSAAIGVQRKYAYSRAGSIYNIVTANGFTTNELAIRNTGNTAEAQLNTGGPAVDGTNTILANIWSNANKIIFEADRIIEAAPQYSDPGYASGLISFASIYKAMALGSMAMYWEKVPDSIGTNVSFSDRATGFQKAIATINTALSTIQANPISASFQSAIVAGTDIPNTLYGLKARYALFAGDYATALAAANEVSLSAKSVMSFDAVSVNPIYETATSTNNVFQPVDATFGLPDDLKPTADDKRVAFYTSQNTVVLPLYRINGFGAVAASPWPYYLPGEITLIKAECYVRQASPSLPDAITEINNIRTKTAAADAFGIGADESVYAGAVTADALLTEIYRQRCIELFMSGLKMEDMRRFNRPDSEKKRNLFPYPFIERDNNSNTPADPAF